MKKQIFRQIAKFNFEFMSFNEFFLWTNYIFKLSGRRWRGKNNFFVKLQSSILNLCHFTSFSFFIYFQDDDDDDDDDDDEDDEGKI